MRSGERLGEIAGELWLSRRTLAEAWLEERRAWWEASAPGLELMEVLLRMRVAGERQWDVRAYSRAYKDQVRWACRRHLAWIHVFAPLRLVSRAMWQSQRHSSSDELWVSYRGQLAHT